MFGSTHSPSEHYYITELLSRYDIPQMLGTRRDSEPRLFLNALEGVEWRC